MNFVTLTRKRLLKNLVGGCPFEKQFRLYTDKYGFMARIFAECYALMISQTDNFVIKDWEEIQERKLVKLLNSALQTVPFWRRYQNQDMLSAAKTAREAIKSFPVLTRGLVKLKIKELINPIALARNYVATATSGSTGQPLAFFQDSTELKFRLATALTELQYIGAKSNSIVILGLQTHRYLDALGQRFSGQDLESVQYRYEKFYPYLLKYSSETLIGTTSLIQRLSVLVRHDKKTIKFKHILYRGEAFDSIELKQIEKEFEAECFSSYGTRECSMIALQCKERQFHTVPWMNYIEILDSSGNGLSVGEEGRIVITYFKNFVMPFIRYDIGDRGKINTELCPCGRQTPTIIFTGRTGGSIETPSGKSVMLLSITSLIAKIFYDSIERFQIEQSDPANMIFRFIPSKSFSPVIENKLLKALNEIFKNQMQVNLEKISGFIPNDMGKIPLFIKKF